MIIFQGFSYEEVDSCHSQEKFGYCYAEAIRKTILRTQETHWTGFQHNSPHDPGQWESVANKLKTYHQKYIFCGNSDFIIPAK